MIVQENRELNGMTFCVHYSDADMMIRKVGTEQLYVEAWDLIPCRYEYEETSKPVPRPEPDPELITRP